MIGAGRRRPAPIGSKDRINLSRLLRLAPHARACSVDGLLIFLDLKRDRYSAVPARQFSNFRADAPILAVDGDMSASLAQLVQRGLVEDANAKPAKRDGLAWPLFAAFLWASLGLQTRRLDWVAASLSHAKRQNSAGDDVQRLLTYYETWRPWWPADRVCLFDSLSLCLFLTSRGVCADLVFGVVGQPFAAHAWAEIAGQVINDDEASCRTYCEIARA